MVFAVESALLAGGPIDEEVVFQHGTSHVPTLGTAHDFMPRAQHERLVCEASLVVGHAGVGTILMCARQGKRAVVMPRRADHGEQANDHQVELAERLASLGLVFVARDAADLTVHLKRPRADFLIEPPARNIVAVEQVRRFLGEIVLASPE
jgi:UDP-N-acetylglucosamine transferase subunit ALG13